MSTATAGRHAAPSVHDRRSWFGRPWRRRRQSAPAGENPYPAAASDAEITELVAGLRPVSPQPAFAGTSLPQPDSVLLPDDTGTLAAIRDDAVPEALRTLQRVRDGLADLDKPEPLAFIRRGDPDGGWGEHWALDGGPAFLGLERCGDRKVAQVALGKMEDRSPLVFAGDVAAIDAVITVLMVARDRLAYGGGTGSAPAAEPPASEPETGTEAPAGGEPEPAPDAEGTGRHHAALYSRADELLGLAAEVAGCDGVQAAVTDLVQAMNLHKSAAGGMSDPSLLFADLVPGEPGAWDEAMARLAAQIAGAEAALTEVTGRYRGEDMAAGAAGQAGGAK